jgi:hypothetical protein
LNSRVFLPFPSSGFSLRSFWFAGTRTRVNDEDRGSFNNKRVPSEMEQPLYIDSKIILLKRNKLYRNPKLKNKKEKEKKNM